MLDERRSHSPAPEVGADHVARVGDVRREAAEVRHEVIGAGERALRACDVDAGLVIDPRLPEGCLVSGGFAGEGTALLDHERVELEQLVVVGLDRGSDRQVHRALGLLRGAARLQLRDQQFCAQGGYEVTHRLDRALQ